MSGDAGFAPGAGRSGFAACAAELTGRFRRTRPLRAGSLIVTLFGDAILPRGGSIWLGSLARLLAPFGISDRLVRTSVFRLARDGWLQSEQVGRRSYYRPTADGRRRFDRAAARIYSPPQSSFAGDWTLVVLPLADASLRDRLRKSLAWLGFGRMDAGVLAHPAADAAALADALEEAGATDAVVTMMAAPCQPVSADALGALAAAAWNLDDLQSRYAEFLGRFKPLLERSAQAGPLDPLDCLTVRLLMIHDYRKIVLRDPRLPGDALPGDWVGYDAYRLCRRLYKIVAHGAERCLAREVETVAGPLPRADASLRARFADELG